MNRRNRRLARRARAEETRLVPPSELPDLGAAGEVTGEVTGSAELPASLADPDYAPISANELNARLFVVRQVVASLTTEQFEGLRGAAADILTDAQKQQFCAAVDLPMHLLQESASRGQRDAVIDRMREAFGDLTPDQATQLRAACVRLARIFTGEQQQRMSVALGMPAVALSDLLAKEKPVRRASKRRAKGHVVVPETEPKEEPAKPAEVETAT